MKESEYEKVLNLNKYTKIDMTLDEFWKYYDSPVGLRLTNVLFLVVADGDYDKSVYVYANNEFDAVYIAQKMWQDFWFDVLAIPIYTSFIKYAYNF